MATTPFGRKGNKMNKDKIIELLQDGAYLNALEYRFYHPSFRKGYRAMRSSDISFMAAMRALGAKLVYSRETQTYKLV
jgi:hypothetical protein